LDYSARFLLAISDVSIPTVIFVFLLMAVSAFFSMSETVFSSVNVIRLKTFIEEGKKGSKKALWISDHFDLTLSTILVGNNLANIALATLSVSVFSDIFNGQQTIVNIMNTVVMTTLILIFGEIVPKSFGKTNAEDMSLSISPFLYWVIYVLRPVTYVFLKIKKLIVRDNGLVTISVTGEELNTIIDTMEEEGSIDEDEAEMLQSVLDLSHKKIYEIMTPRVDMIGVEVNDDIEEIKKIFFEYQFSRLPVYEETRDNVVGILHERDFFTKLIKNEQIDLRKLMKEPMFVSKSMRVDTLIETLQRENFHMAIVSGEYGGTSGIVTMEDALEELVGEIYDEHDIVEEEFIRQVAEYSYEVNADMDIADLFDDLELGNPPYSHYANVGGWLYDSFEEIPQIEDRYSFIQEIQNYEHDDDEPTKIRLTFIIKEIRERRITRVQLEVEMMDEEE